MGFVWTSTNMLAEVLIEYFKIILQGGMHYDVFCNKEAESS